MDARCEPRNNGVKWYQSADARGIVMRYAAWMAALNLAWEIAHLPLYTLWTEAQARSIAFAVVHCTLGDLLIGLSALALALVATRAGDPVPWKWRTVTAVTVLIGTGYTALSEWLNTAVRASWAYSDLMPVIQVAGLEFGVSPLLQWVVLPPVALALAGAIRSSRISR